jgi:hypothetical protein
MISLPSATTGLGPLCKPQYFYLSSHVQPLNREFQLRSIACAHFEDARVCYCRWAV